MALLDRGALKYIETAEGGAHLGGIVPVAGDGLAAGVAGGEPTVAAWAPAVEAFMHPPVIMTLPVIYRKDTGARENEFTAGLPLPEPAGDSR